MLSLCCGSFIRQSKGTPASTRASSLPDVPFAPAWPLQDAKVPKAPTNPQLHSPLFGKLSTELRLIIYEAVLTDPTRFLHICQTKGDTSSRRQIAHVWCTDTHSRFPTWQHSCFGDIMRNGTNPSHVRITQTDDKLLSPLFSCRAM
jgi:hypothetical protein